MVVTQENPGGSWYRYWRATSARNARSPELMAAAIISLADAGRGRALGTAGRLRVQRQFTIDRMVDDYAREYDRILTPPA